MTDCSTIFIDRQLGFDNQRNTQGYYSPQLKYIYLTGAIFKPGNHWCIIEVINHESMHKILHDIEDFTTTAKYDWLLNGLGFNIVDNHAHRPTEIRDWSRDNLGIKKGLYTHQTISSGDKI